jgi:hypothetical protein
MAASYQRVITVTYIVMEKSSSVQYTVPFRSNRQGVSRNGTLRDARTTRGKRPSILFGQKLDINNRFCPFLTTFLSKSVGDTACAKWLGRGTREPAITTSEPRQTGRAKPKPLRCLVSGPAWFQIGRLVAA